MKEIKREDLGHKNKMTGNIDALWLDMKNNQQVVVCGKCGEKQNMFITRQTGFIEELDFICCKCKTRNTLSSY